MFHDRYESFLCYIMLSDRVYMENFQSDSFLDNFGVISIRLKLTFFSGRYFMKETVTKWIGKIQNQYFRNIIHNIGEERNALTFALLLRLSPVPSWANNYGLSVSPVAFSTFLLANIGSIPMVIQHAYVGSLFQNATAINLTG